MDHAMNRLRIGCISSSQVQLAIFYIFMVSLNGLAIATFKNGATDGYAISYVQPDANTFSIWGVIYATLVMMVFNADRLVPEARTNMCTAFLMNGLWLITNGLAVNEGWSYWGAVFVLALYMASLWKVYYVMDVNYKRASLYERATLYAPLSLNVAWVTLACILNFTNTAMNDKVDFSKRDNRTTVGGPDWSMGVLMLASLLASYLSLVKGDAIYAATTVWALQGVRRHQTKGSGFPHIVSPKVHDLADLLSIGVAVFAVLGFLRMLLYVPFVRKEVAVVEGEAILQKVPSQIYQSDEAAAFLVENLVQAKEPT